MAWIYYNNRRDDPYNYCKQVVIGKRKKCEICSYNKHINVHHIVPLSKGGAHSQRNLSVLCPNHHAEAHAKEIDLGPGEIDINSPYHPHIVEKRREEENEKAIIECHVRFNTKGLSSEMQKKVDEYNAVAECREKWK